MINFMGEFWPSLGNIGITLAVLSAVVGFVVWRGRRRGSKTIALDAALTVSGLWVMSSLAGAVIIVLKAFTVDWAELHGTTSVWFPWPTDLCSALAMGGTTTCQSENLSDFTVEGASLGLRLLAGSAQLFSMAFSTTPAMMLAVICFQTLRGRTFSRTVTRVLTGGAIAVLALGIVSELLGGVAATLGLREVVDQSSQWYPMVFQLTVTPLPFVGALGLAALAAVFRQGMRLQSENELLQRETEGLV
ncbi:hypothetical protein [Microbacterium sp. TWP3-1-2b2]|uniref:hypothetical protein n=1 Tax=Microbacterium sp. TWP3-1-2b2 TaxID=2804651 RepID=UPI003CFAC743